MNTPIDAAARSFRVGVLTLGQVRMLYRERLKQDFPANEVKPLWIIERAMSRGEYICYGAVEGDEILAYAFFVVSGRRALFDYYAVARDLRDMGIGSRFIRALIEGPLSGMDCVLLEVDDPDCATGDEAALREKRLSFYLRNGLTDTGVRAEVFRVRFRILALPVGGEREPAEVRRIYSEIYHAILPKVLCSKWVEVFN